MKTWEKNIGRVEPYVPGEQPKVKDVVKLTGISEPQVQRIFRRKDFPVCDYGKQKLVEIDAFKEYFQHPVLTTDDEDNG